MERDEGFRRDVAAIRTVRETIGSEVRLMIDGNNGFDLKEAIRLMEEVGDSNLYWAEEMFPETVEDCRVFRGVIRGKGWETLVADGEGHGATEPFVPLLKAGVLDVVQANINRTGLTEYRRLAQTAGEYGAYVAPHSWGSQFGLFVSAHLAKATPNFLSCEVTAYVFDVFLPVGFAFRDGQYFVSEVPGFGVIVNERVYHEKYRKDEMVYELK